MKGSINVWSKYVEANFHIRFFVYVSAAGTVDPPLFIVPRKHLNIDVMEECDTDGSCVTTSQKGFINSTFLVKLIELFDASVPD